MPYLHVKVKVFTKKCKIALPGPPLRRFALPLEALALACFLLLAALALVLRFCQLDRPFVGSAQLGRQTLAEDRVALIAEVVERPICWIVYEPRFVEGLLLSLHDEDAADEERVVADPEGVIDRALDVSKAVLDERGADLRRLERGQLR